MVFFWRDRILISRLGTDLRRRCVFFKCYFWEVDETEQRRNNLLDNFPDKEAPNVVLRDSAAVVPSTVLTLGSDLLLTPGVVCVKYAQGCETERERGRFRRPFLRLNLWKQMYFSCISASQDVSAAFEVHIPVSLPPLRSLSHPNSCILTNRSRQKLHISALLSSR